MKAKNQQGRFAGSFKSEQKIHGFSLTELMVVCAILAIIVSVALPSYQSYVLKSRRSDGLSALLECSSLQRKRFTVTNSFQSQTSPPPVYLNPNSVPDSALGVPTGSTAACAPYSERGFYSLSVSVPVDNPTRFIITATPLGPQVRDLQCRSLALTNTGQRNATPAPVETCWNN